MTPLVQAARRHGKSAAVREEALPQVKVGDTIMFRDSRYGTFGHTGKVRKVGRLYFTIKPTDPKGVKRVPKNDVFGFWLKGAKKRDVDHLIVNLLARTSRGN